MKIEASLNHHGTKSTVLIKIDDDAHLCWLNDDGKAQNLCDWINKPENNAYIKILLIEINKA